MFPTLYKQCEGSFMSLRIYYVRKGCEMGHTVYSLYPRRLESLTTCRCHNYKGSTFSSVIQGPRVLVWQEFEPVASCTADWCLSNCITPAARRLCCKGTKYTCIMPTIVLHNLTFKEFFKVHSFNTTLIHGSCTAY